MRSYDNAYKEQGMLNAHQRIKSLLAFLQAKSVRKILQVAEKDVDSTLLLAADGFEVTLLDASPPDIAALEAKLKDQDIPLNLVKTISNKESLPEGYFDFLLAYNSIYYTDYEGIKRLLEEFFRWLRGDGLFYVTFASTSHKDYGKGEELETNTFRLGGITRHYCSAAEIVELFRFIEIIDLRNEEQDSVGSFHWHVLGRNRDLSPSDEELPPLVLDNH